MSGAAMNSLSKVSRPDYGQGQREQDSGYSFLLLKTSESWRTHSTSNEPSLPLRAPRESHWQQPDRFPSEVFWGQDWCSHQASEPRFVYLQVAELRAQATQV